ncbi:exonuclease domain-containing protein [Marinobacter sediminum]|uniref:exonuclease domain-containing protein n=1 Tax=Marinobacter sediminum TaxID=256323 RepID=UPI0035645A4D
MTEQNLLIVDLEATCWSDQYTPEGVAQSIHNMEIIELGCALANRHGDLLDARSFLVRPTRNPMLSDFCTNLTGITQSMVDSAPTLPQAVEAMNTWLGDLSDAFAWCSWGNYDRLHLEAQSRLDGAQPKILSRAHLNLKRIWRRTTGQKKKNGLASALAFHDLVFLGNPHRGVDDARNIARLLPFMNWSLESELLTIPTSDNHEGI